MAEEEGFEPPRLLQPVGFQDRSLQPDLGIPPYYSIIFFLMPVNFLVDPVGLEPTADRL
jgi:hypothetical protein